jgi:hypothetical protein
MEIRLLRNEFHSKVAGGPLLEASFRVEVLEA